MRKMIDHSTANKIRDKINKDEHKLRKSITEIERIWEDTGLGPKDPTYLVEKTMRFEMAQESIIKVFSLFNETISDYKRLLSELERSDESE
jgi:hypothetical protein